MILTRPLPPITTAYAESNTNNKNTYDYLTGLCDEIECGQSYSQIPVRIGTWIDGTPVWRAAFKVELTESIKSDNCFDVFSDLAIVHDSDYVALVIGGFACIDNGSVVDNNTTVLDAHGEFSWNVINPDAEYITGYIDFVTPADNIIEE